MKEKQLLETKEINIDDWEATPVKVKDLVVQQREEIEKLEQRLKELEVKIDHLQEKVNRNSTSVLVKQIEVKATPNEDLASLVGDNMLSIHIID